MALRMLHQLWIKIQWYRNIMTDAENHACLTPKVMTGLRGRGCHLGAGLAWAATQFLEASAASPFRPSCFHRARQRRLWQTWDSILRGWEFGIEGCCCRLKRC